MDKAPVFQAEISHRYISENKGSAELTLPATCFEIQDALERAGLEAGDEAFCEIIGYPRFPFLEDCLEFTLDPYALNALAEKLDSLADWQRDAFEGLVIMAIQRSGSVTLGELYDFAASADECQVLYDAHSDAELGRFYVDNGFVPEAEDITAALYRLLDFEKIGKEYREGEGGVFLRHGSGYVVQTGELREEFKDLDLTPREPDYAVLMEVGLPDTDVRVLLKLPCAPHDLYAALESLGVQDQSLLSWRCADCRIENTAEGSRWKLTADCYPGRQLDYVQIEDDESTRVYSEDGTTITWVVTEQDAPYDVYFKDAGTAVTSVTFASATATVEVGESITLTPTILPEDATDKTLSWVSFDTSIPIKNKG